MIQEKKELRNIVRINTADIESYNLIRFDKNERPYGFPEEFNNFIRSSITSELINAYPTNIDDLVNKLSETINIAQDEIFLSAGSDQSIKAIFETFVDYNDKIILLKPGFAMYSVYAEMFGADVVNISYNDNFLIDFKSIKKKISSGIRLLVIENPNGFIGSVSERNEILELVRLAEQREVIVVVDEAYHEFHKESFIDEINNYNNLIITRTFSKALGLAGLRIGYAASNKRLISLLNKVRIPFAVTGFSSLIGMHILENPQYATDYIDMVCRNRPYFINQLQKLSLEAFNTRTNFIILKVPGFLRFSDVEHRLIENGILVRRPFLEGFLKGLMRVSVGTKNQIDLFVDTLSAILD